MEAWEAWKAWEAAWETQKEGRPRATSCSVRIFSIKPMARAIPGFPMTAKSEKKARCRVQNGRQARGQSGAAPTHPCTHVVSFEWHTAAASGFPWRPGLGLGRWEIGSRWTRRKEKKRFEWRPVSQSASQARRDGRQSLHARRFDDVGETQSLGSGSGCSW